MNKKFSLLLGVALSLSSPALADQRWDIPPASIRSCNAQFCVLKTGAMVIAPTNDVRVVAICKDGFQWRAHIAKNSGHRGACRGHHGVQGWTDGTLVKLRGINSRTSI